MRKSFWVSITLGLAAYLTLPLPGLSAPLSQRIEKKRSEIAKVKQREGVLTTTISRYNTRIESLQGEISATEGRLSRVQEDLDRKRAELIEVRNELEEARDRLERLRRELRVARRVLANRLVEIYKSDTPDALTVVLEADGFADLLERAEFLDRISDQDREITDRVRRLRDQAEIQEERLARLEQRVEEVAMAILQRRDEIAAARDQLVGSRDDLREALGSRRAVLAQVRDRRVRAQEDLAALEREQARVRAALLAASNQAFTPQGGPGPIRRGSGRLIWPVSGSLSSGFGQRWGRLHAGVDIAAPEGTPIRAADSGRVTLAAWTGGYGNYTCVQHTGSMSTCYAHQSRLGTSVGASVGQGQVIGYVGNTGNSFGAHLHFEVRIGGSPVDPLGYL
jgi:murein DD-endopeptidase MepM/ murein hydrolase activator NlpD